MNSITDHDVPIPRKTREDNKAQNPKSDKDTEVTKEKERIYGIGRINLDDPAVEPESESKQLLAKHWEG